MRISVRKLGGVKVGMRTRCMREVGMKFEIIGEILHAETIAEGNGIRNLPLLRKQHGLGNWRKKKGVAQIKLPDGSG